MKVFFSGAHSTGKSTLTRFVSEKYNLPILVESARSVLAEKELQLDSLRSDIKLVNEYQKAVYFRQLEVEKGKDKFVSDRSLLDCLAYCCSHSFVFNELLNKKETKKYVKMLKNNDVFIFFIRPSKVTMKEDGVRESLNWDEIVRIDAMIKLMLQMFKVPYFDIHAETMQERANLILNILNRINIG